MPDRATNEPPWTLASLNMAADVDLRSCPFCGSGKLGFYEYTYSKLFTLNCGACGAQGPRHSSPGEAQTLWNTRAPYSVPEKIREWFRHWRRRFLGSEVKTVDPN